MVTETLTNKNEIKNPSLTIIIALIAAVVPLILLFIINGIYYFTNVIHLSRF